MKITQMSPEERRRKVDELFIRIAMVADFTEDKKVRDSRIKPMADELWAITKEQWKLGELEHLHSNLK